VRSVPENARVQLTPRLATGILFGVNGVMFGTWAANIPWLQAHLGASKTELGFALLCMAVGALVAMPLAGQALTRIPTARLTTGSALAYTVLLPLPLLAPSPIVLALTLSLFGALNGVMDVSMNAHGVAVEERYGRPILSSLHAGWSFGSLIGAVLVALGTTAAIYPPLQAAAVAAVLWLIALLASRRLGPSADHPEQPTGRIVLPSRAVLPLGVIAVAAALIEGGLADWSGIYLRGDLRAEPGLAAAGFAALSLGMAFGRLSGDAINRWIGPSRLIATGMLLVAAALGVALALANVPVAIVALAIAGLGIANAIPVLFSAAGRIPPSGPSLSAVFTVGYSGFLFGPPIVGSVADQIGLPGALAGLAIIAGITALVVPTVLRTERTITTAEPAEAAATPSSW
jgi:predicted MFS family arabinose efflux permease